MRTAIVERALAFDGRIVRIFKSFKAYSQIASEALAPITIDVVPYAEAVGSIRRQVIARAGNVCERCGEILTEATGEMHETIPRSKGGEISLANCEWLCHDCHQGKPDSAHGNRRTRFGEHEPEITICPGCKQEIVTTQRVIQDLDGKLYHYGSGCITARSANPDSV